MGLVTVHSTMRCTSLPVLKDGRKLQLLLPQCRGHAPEKSVAQKSRTDCTHAQETEEGQAPLCARTQQLDEWMQSPAQKWVREWRGGRGVSL